MITPLDMINDTIIPDLCCNNTITAPNWVYDYLRVHDLRDCLNTEEYLEDGMGISFIRCSGVFTKAIASGECVTCLRQHLHSKGYCCVMWFRAIFHPMF